MKKILFLFLSFTALVFSTSCSNDDDKNSTPKVQGKWFYDSNFYSDTYGVTPSDSDWYIFNNNCSGKKDRVEFKSNGEAKSFWYSDSCEEFSYDETWSLNGNILSWSSDGFEDDYEILELTSKTLKLKRISNFDTYYIVLKK